MHPRRPGPRRRPPRRATAAAEGKGAGWCGTLWNATRRAPGCVARGEKNQSKNARRTSRYRRDSLAPLCDNSQLRVRRWFDVERKVLNHALEHREGLDGAELRDHVPAAFDGEKVKRPRARHVIRCDIARDLLVDAPRTPRLCDGQAERACPPLVALVRNAAGARAARERERASGGGERARGGVGLVGAYWEEARRRGFFFCTTTR